MHIGIPQLILLVLIFLGTGLHLARDGKPKEGKYCFTTALFSDAIIIGLLYWGGFFDGR